MMDDNVIDINVNILQWNCQSLRPKRLSLESLLAQEKVHLVVLSETWLEPDSYFRINGYKTYRRDRSDGYGGVAILVHNSIKSVICPIECPNIGIELLQVKLLNCQHIKNILSVYCPSTVQTSQNDWDYLFSRVNNKSLILGDFNGHHINWSNKTDRRGQQILDATLENNCVYLNNGSPTRVRLVNGSLQKSSPDISFVSTDLATLLTWNTTNESLGSDHLMIKISINIRTHRKAIKKRNFRNSDWKSYTTCVDATFSEFDIPQCPQEFYDKFEYTLQTAANKFIPYKVIPQNISNKFNAKPYWNTELSKAVAERRLALAKLRRNPSPINLEILQEKIRTAQRLIRQSKNKSWQRFCSSINETSSPSEMWRKMRWIKGHRSNTIKCSIDKSVAEKLLQSLAPDYTCPPQPQFHSINSKLESEITIQELENSIKKTDTAPGCDEISFSMVNNLSLLSKQLLVKLYNIILISAFVPRQWRQIKIVPIPKAGKESDQAVRPISLISCLCKIFHSILNKRLEWYFEKQMIFSDNVVGFRKSKSCYDNLTRLVSKIQIGFSKDLTTVACFLDIENAYNNIDVRSLLDSLDKLGVGSNICMYLWSFLKDRHLKLAAEGYEIVRFSCIGLAQGDPLSPLLFNAATNSICKTTQNVQISQYADDFVLYVSSNKVDLAVKELHKACTNVNLLLNSLGLRISSTKSKLCIFKKGGFRSSLQFRFNNQFFPVVKHFKYLGLWLDDSLKWKKHINETIQKVSRYINLLKVLSGPGWGIHQKHLRHLYISIIRSRIDYASFLYGSSCKTNLKKMDRIQNQSLRVIGGFIRSTPIHVMENELCLPPLQFRRKYLAGKFWLKCKSLTNNSTINILKELALLSSRRYWYNKSLPLLINFQNYFHSVKMHNSGILEMFSMNMWVSNIAVQHIISDSIPKIDRAKRTYNSNELKLICMRFIENKYGGWYYIFTDGSKDKSGAGSAFLDPNIGCNVKLKIDSDISIMHIEMIAIAEALEYIGSINFDRFVILTDSKSALLHLARCTSHVRGIPIAYRILESILRLKSCNKLVNLQWIPSHIQLKENEDVDLLAKQAITDGIPTSVLPTYLDYIKVVKKQCGTEWQEYFDQRSCEKGIWYRTIQPHIFRFPWIVNAKYNRDVLKTALRLRSGHIPSSRFAFLMNRALSPNCDECGVVEDVTHILTECVRNESFRKTHLGARTTQVGYLNSILAFPMSEEAGMLYKLAKLGLNK